MFRCNVCRYERYGCSKDAIMEAAGVVADTAEFYCLNFGLPLDALSALGG
jgi:hypothetical protein